MDSKMKEIDFEEQPAEVLPLQYIDYLSLSQIVITQMSGAFGEDLEDMVKDTFTQRILKGEMDLYTLAKSFSNRFFAGCPVQNRGFTNYYDYLRFIYENSPAALKDSAQHLENERAREFLDQYPALINGELDEQKIQELKNEKLFIEVACPHEDLQLQHGPDDSLAFIILRRKDTDRAIEKIAYRLLLWELYKKYPHIYQEPKHPVINDWFAMKLVFCHREQAEKESEHFYHNLALFGLKPDPRRGPIHDERGKLVYDLAGEIIYQPSGKDNHYRYGKGYDNLIQISTVRINGYSHSLREIVFTDVINMLVDEMDHLKFRERQKSEISDWLESNPVFKNKFERYLQVGNELSLLLPEPRARILAPGEYFSEENNEEP